MNHKAKTADAPAFQRIVREQLCAAGRSDVAADRLLEFDSIMFQWNRQIAKGEVPAILIAELGVGMVCSQFLYLTAILRIQHGVGRAVPEPATIGLLAEELNIDPSGASRIASDLIAQGFVRREAAQEDGRKSILTLTDEAKRIFDDFRRLRWEKYLSMFEGWEDQDIADLTRLFARYASNFREAYHLPVPPNAVPPSYGKGSAPSEDQG